MRCSSTGRAPDFDSGSCRFKSYRLNHNKKMLEGSHRLTVRTLVFHTSNRGSIPRASTKLGKYDMLDYIEAAVLVVVLLGLAGWFYLEKR